MNRALWMRIGQRSMLARRGDVEQATRRDEAMMARALVLARRAADLGEIPVGAVVYHTPSGAVLGEGHNQREHARSPAAHAEFLAIERACAARKDWRLNDCTLVVTLEPCAMCAGLIINARVGRVVYGAADPKAGAAGSLYALTEDRRLNHRVRPIPGVQGEACALLLREFFERLRSARKTRARASGSPRTRRAR
ncbi:MAG: hypothetical protein HBSAPP03_09340 [Phycisphaerae bacterium]|nr:MAG: hypothetical protein HBSAPP03_09340 [Phycisphaerae bacterium]